MEMHRMADHLQGGMDKLVPISSGGKTPDAVLGQPNGGNAEGQRASMLSTIHRRPFLKQANLGSAFLPVCVSGLSKGCKPVG
jgi:hypothetical protein